MKRDNYWQLLVAVTSMALASCVSNRISQEEWNEIGASVASSMKFYIAVEKTETQARERYNNRLTLDYREWDIEDCIHEVRLATLKHIVAHFHETSEWETIPTMRDDFKENEVWTDIKDAIPSALKKLRNATAIEQVKWTIDNVAKEYDRLNRVEFKLPEFRSKSKDREVYQMWTIRLITGLWECLGSSL